MKHVLFAGLFGVFISGCDLRILVGNMPGGDRDASGCLGSGGARRY